MFRGYVALDGVEIANSSRVAAHIGAEVPTSDLGLLTAPGDCSMTPITPGALLANLEPSQSLIAEDRLLATPADGSRLYSKGLAVVGDCWTPNALCFSCRETIGYDDSWPGLKSYLQDTIYRPELAPWFSTRVPESAEFAGVWLLDVKGLETTPTQVEITENAGDGGAPGPVRTPSRKVTFDAYLLACTNAGLTWGLGWLNAQLRKATGTSVLRYLAAHPEHSEAVPASLVREVHGVVLSQEPTITDGINAGRGPHHQATSYRVTWEMTVTQPYAYSPPVQLDIDWDTTIIEPIKWVHAADCEKPKSCAPMPAIFSTECEVERIEVVNTPPPSCGGCMPVCAVQTQIWQMPTFDWPIRSHETAVTLSITNKGGLGLTLQAYWRRCNTREDCEDNRFPLQVSGLPPTAELVLDGISGTYWVNYVGRKRRPFGIVGTPEGAPWRPPLIDRSDCWELVIQSSGNETFDVMISLADREA